MIYNILDLILFSVLNLALTYTLFEFNEVYFDKKYLYSKTTSFAVYGIYYITSIIHYYLKFNMWVNVFSSFIFVFMLLNLYKSTLKNRLVITSIILIFMMSIEIFVGAISNVFIGTQISDTKVVNLTNIILMSISRIILLIFVQLYKNYIKKRNYINYDVFDKKLKYILIIPILNIVSVVILGSILYIEQLSETIHILIMILIIIATLLNTLFFSIYNTILSLVNNKVENLLLNHQINYYDKEFKKTQMHLEDVRKIKHDLRYKLINIMSNSKRDEQFHYEEINNIIKEFDNIDYTIYSKNIALDTILNYQINIAKTKNIDIDITINVTEEIEIQGKYLCVIVGNILENAIEGCEDVKTPYIKINILQENKSFYMSVSNPFSKEIKLKDNKYLSTKEDSQNRGYGLKSIFDLISTLGGTVKIDTNDNKFTIDFVVFYRN